MMKRIANRLGQGLAHYLNQPISRYEPFDISDPARVASVLRPADVLLVDGNSRVSTAIKYLTQSTWSHAALYVGDFLNADATSAAGQKLIEADLGGGVIAVSLHKYARLNTRICRPVGLTGEECRRVCQYAIDRLGHAYDLKNVIDLARYLLPVPPVPVVWRRRMLALGSGDPTRAITAAGVAGYSRHEIHHIRHYSLFAPRDFDVSPYFRIIKPTLESGFDPHQLTWADEAGDA
jgi:hypothetical protein